MPLLYSYFSADECPMVSYLGANRNKTLAGTSHMSKYCSISVPIPTSSGPHNFFHVERQRDGKEQALETTGRDQRQRTYCPRSMSWSSKPFWGLWSLALSLPDFTEMEAASKKIHDPYDEQVQMQSECLFHKTLAQQDGCHHD